MVHLRHANGFESQYLHLSTIAVHAGARVRQGELIGRVGSTGLATARSPCCVFRRRARFESRHFALNSPGTPLARNSHCLGAIMTIVSIAELQRKGIAISTDAAVAIAQQVIHSRGDDAPEPPFGPPTAATVHLRADGTVRCASSETTPAVSEVAILLWAMLPAGTPLVPGGLRHAIARALLDVDAPPFDSLQSFSEALARFEHGDRASLVRGLVERWETIAITTRRPVRVERRRSAPSSDQLRRQLRDADMQLYQHSCDVQRMIRPALRRTRMLPALAAGLAGVALLGAGEFMQPQRADLTTSPPLVRSANLPPRPDVLRAIDPPAQPTPSTLHRDGARRPVRLVRHVESRSNVSEASRHPRGPQPRGLLERMRLQWLKNAFTAKSDLP